MTMDKTAALEKSAAVIMAQADVIEAQDAQIRQLEEKLAAAESALQSRPQGKQASSSAAELGSAGGRPSVIYSEGEEDADARFDRVMRTL